MDQNPSLLSKSDRKSTEKHRRDHMKSLYCQLSSLLPNQSSKEVVSLTDQLGEAADYIKKLQERLEVMKQKKSLLKKRKSANSGSSLSSRNETDSGAGELKLPRIEVHDNASASTLDVVLITGFKHQYMFKEIVRILNEECGEVVCAGFSVVDQTVFHTVHCKIGVECEAAGVSERLRNLVHDDK